ncbi:TPA: GDP-mannose 4,6-dehydratase [Stenotrophomonas maltophilia]|nr:GDP-mannose 4,6-dehydratase [Stenotrophomonas maltophilia]
MLHGSVEDLPAERARAGRRRVEARAALELGLRLGDLLLLPGMAVLSHVLCYATGAPSPSQRIVFGAVILSAIVCFSIAPVYRNWRVRGLLADLWLLLLAWSGTFALFSLYAVLVGLGDAVPAQWLVGWYFTGLASMATVRVLLRVQLHRLRSRGLDRERVLLVGLRAPALRLHRLLRGKPELGKEVVGYFEDGKETRDFVFIDDVVAATVSAIDADVSGQAFNVGTGEATDVITVASALKDAYGKGGEIRISGNYRIGDIRHNFADLSRAEAAIGYRPRVTFAEGVKRFAAWVLTQQIEDSGYQRSVDEMRAKGLLK